MHAHGEKVVASSVHSCPTSCLNSMRGRRGRKKDEEGRRRTKKEEDEGERNKKEKTGRQKTKGKREKVRQRERHRVKEKERQPERKVRRERREYVCIHVSIYVGGGAFTSHQHPLPPALSLPLPPFHLQHD